MWLAIHYCLKHSGSRGKDSTFDWISGFVKRRKQYVEISFIVNNGFLWFEESKEILVTAGVSQVTALGSIIFFCL